MLNKIEVLPEEVQGQVEDLKDEEQVAETDGGTDVRLPSDATAEGKSIVAEEVQVGRVGASASLSLSFLSRSNDLNVIFLQPNCTLLRLVVTTRSVLLAHTLLGFWPWGH